MTGISARIKKLRTERNLNQAQIASYLGITQQSYSHYEQNQRELPTRHVVKIAQFYHVSSEYLLGVSTCRFTNFDLNADFIQDISFQHLITILNKLNNKKRLELVHFLSYLDSANQK